MKAKVKQDTTLLEAAIQRLKSFSNAELKQFMKTNCCPHPTTHACGMDRICDVCGDWV